MKKLLVLFCLSFPSFAYAAEDDCPSAADAAEAQNPNAYKNCDYTKTGLNGVLHRAFKEKSDETDEIKNSKENNNQKAVVLSKNETEVINSAEFTSAQQLQSVRFRLIQKIANECQKGFAVEAERYLPTQTKSLVLDLVYHCL